MATIRVSGAKSEQRDKFAKNLAMGLSNKEAYIKAGFKDGKYAANEASRMKGYDDVQHAYHYWKSKIFKKLDISEEGIVRQYASIAGSDIRDYVDEKGNPIPINRLAPHVAAAVKSFEIKTYTTRDDEFVTEYKYVLYDKMTALKELKDSKIRLLDDMAKQQSQQSKMEIKLNVNGLTIKRKQKEKFEENKEEDNNEQE